jgi:hypothetical protein
MGALNDKQVEFDFDSDILEQAFAEEKAIPRSMPQKKEQAIKTADEFHFEPIVNGNIVDYSDFPANRMYIAKGKNILTTERPQWVPPFEYGFIERNSHMPPVRKMDEYFYMSSGKDDPLYYKMSLDGFAATVDYYVKYGKALNRREAEAKNISLIEEAKKKLNDKEHPLNTESYDYRYYASILNGTHKVRPSPIRLLSIRTMTRSQAAFFKENGIGKKEMWDSWKDIRTSLEQKLIDMSCQYEDLESSYDKGAETSYGDKNTNKTLFEEFGILVKRQNGDAINQKEIGEISDAFNKVKPVFGSIKTLSAEYGLKISHSGIKHMHARKFIGLFNHAYRAIGVKFGDTTKGHLVLAHELAHFLDSQAGKETEHFFSSDRPGSKENSIARIFRKEMNQRSKTIKNSKYFQRTCECFARAMEQFAAFVTSPEQYRAYCGAQAYVPDTPFQEKLLPLIRKLIIERQELWHKGELNMKNSPEIFKALEQQAERETVDYRPPTDIAEMDDDFLEQMSRLACNRHDESQKTIESYKAMAVLPNHLLEMLKESQRGKRLGALFEEEYQKRLKKPDSALFPVYPGDITANRFKEHFLTLMKSNEYNKTPAHVVSLLLDKASRKNEREINELLKNEGCVNEEATLKILAIWTGGEKSRKPRKSRDAAEPGMAF